MVAVCIHLEFVTDLCAQTKCLAFSVPNHLAHPKEDDVAGQGCTCLNQALDFKATMLKAKGQR